MSAGKVASRERGGNSGERESLGDDRRVSAGGDQCMSAGGTALAAVKFDVAASAQARAAWWAALPFGRGVELLTHDANGVAALSKPAGLLSHPNAAGDERRALLCAPYDLKEECYELGSLAMGDGGRDANKRPEKEGGLRHLWLLNRLDSATSGVLLVCANRDLALKIRQRFRERAVQKVYAALVFGKPAPSPKGAALPIWRDRLTIEKRGGQIRTKAASGALARSANGARVLAATSASVRVSGGGSHGAVTAETRVKILRVGQGISLLQLEPLTGRSHQLRVQCARRGLPIVGDATYGDFAANRAFAKAHSSTRGRLFLHSLETRFDYEWRGQKTHFAARAPLPETFAQLW